MVDIINKKIAGINMVLFGLVSLSIEHPRQLFRVLKHIFTDYVLKQYEHQPAILIDTLLDKDICLYPEAITTYLSFVPLLLGNFGYINKEFGGKVRGEIDGFLNDLVDLYKNAGFVFENAPTTLGGRESRGVRLMALHFLDKPRNFFPSLHVVMVSHAYFYTCLFIEKYGNGGDYTGVRMELFNKIVKIIESCLLTKQHGIRDIAGGLAMVSLKDKRFDAGMAKEIIYAMFSDNLFGMKEEFISEVRDNIFITYQSIIASAGGIWVDGLYARPLVSYVKSI